MDSRGNSRNLPPPAYGECQFGMRHVSGAAKGEAEKLSNRPEDDTRIHSLLKKIYKRVAVVRAGDKRKREHQGAPIESQCEMTSRLDLSIKELEYSRALTKELPQMRAKLDILMKNHQRLCETIKCKIGLNVENVDQMKMLENCLIGITGKVESLCSEVSNAEKRAKALIPQGVQNTSFNGNGGGYADGFDETHLHGAPMQIMDPYARCGSPVGSPQAISGPVGGADLNLELCL